MNRNTDDYSSLFPCVGEACRIDTAKLGQAKDRIGRLLSPRVEVLEADLTVSIFGKKDCPACRETEDRVKANSPGSSAKLVFYDLDTVDGLVEGSLQNALEVPTTIIRRGEEELARWEGEAPPLPELQRYLSPIRTGL